MKLLAAVALIVLATIICAEENTSPAPDDSKNSLRMPPNITKQPTESLYIFKIESSVRLDCVATGTPKPNYVWYQNKQPINSNIGNVIRDPETGTITIDPLYALNEGTYQCRAENIHGAALSNVIKLERATLADFSATGTTPYTANQGTDLKVNCNAPKTVPDSTYTWATVADANDRNMVPINTDQRINIDDNGNLYFANLMPSDNKGGRLYICNAYNPYVKETKHGSLSSISVIPVANAPDREPEIMYSSTSPTVALTGNDLQLKCLFSARPSDSLKVSWSKVGGDLPTNRYELDQSHSMLTIRDVREEDEATYECRGTNTAGYSLQQIAVRVDSIPTFIDDSKKPRPTNATVGTSVSFVCDTISEPTAEINWLVNGDPLEIGNMGPRFSLSTDHRNLTIQNVCKDCPNGGSDLAVFSCQASNMHGQILANGYLNVLLGTKMTVVPEAVTLEYYSPVMFKCGAEADDSTPVVIEWLRDGEVIKYHPGRIQMEPDNSLYIITENEDDGGASFAGKYSCRASNGYSTMVSDAVELTIPAEPAPIKGGSLADMWWIFLIVAIIILLLLLLLLCCLCIQRNKGDTYPVDAKERANGNDPEKELADSGYHDYQRPEDGPVKGSRASLSSTIKLDSDDEGSLAEYGDIDTGKFNEDGSFIGQYTGDRKKAPPKDSVV